jgi:hypothetical protein
MPPVAAPGPPLVPDRGRLLQLGNIYAPFPRDDASRVAAWSFSQENPSDFFTTAF